MKLINLVKKTIYISIICLISCSENQSNLTNKITGLWLVENVNVGNKNRTPTSKWVRINPDKSSYSGNGWLQHTSGSWSLKSSNLSFDNDQMKDEFGAFKVAITKDKMSWERMEEGQKVVVSLVKIKTIPQASWDKIIGFWNVEVVTEGEVDITTEYDPNDTRKIFMRWDRRYTELNTPNGSFSGNWYIHPHKPELFLIQNNTLWNISFQENKMIWIGLNNGTNKNLKIIYKRTDS